MDKYKAIMQAERVHAILQSVSRGDAVSSQKNKLRISTETIQELVSASEYVKQYLLTSVKYEDEISE